MTLLLQRPPLDLLQQHEDLQRLQVRRWLRVWKGRRELDKREEEEEEEEVRKMKKTRIGRLAGCFRCSGVFELKCVYLDLIWLWIKILSVRFCD